MNDRRPGRSAGDSLTKTRETTLITVFLTPKGCSQTLSRVHAPFSRRGAIGDDFGRSSPTGTVTTRRCLRSMGSSLSLNSAATSPMFFLGKQMNIPSCLLAGSLSQWD